MKLEQQVCNLELSQKLKALGVKQESHFKYCGGHTMYDEDEENGKWEDCGNTDLLGSDEYCDSFGLTCEFTTSAFTVAELGEMLSSTLFKLHITKIGDIWVIQYDSQNDIEAYASAENEADCRAKILVYLIENRLITI